ncbi:1648_t:CDS:2 [Entrophospora sp. SA101]|nr:752_t:CDS:2 [Entrophospora sp. SA101]CAJ0898251.1 1648_t:CDS:2 [Entrophospora sp. SA101]
MNQMNVTNKRINGQDNWFDFRVKEKPQSTILDNFRVIDGRKFHNVENSPYSFPIDEISNYNHDVQHDIYKEIWGENFSSPVHEILKLRNAKVLDCGCGSGKWIKEMAIAYPNSTFIGIDLSVSLTPDGNEKPLNAGFLEVNIIEGLPFPDNTFDYIFQRNMISAFNDSQWPIIVKEYSRVLKPGGYLELCEYNIKSDNLVYSGKLLNESVKGHFESYGFTPILAYLLPVFLEKSKEFKPTVVMEKEIRIGSWGGELGERVVDCMILSWSTCKIIVQAILNIDDDEFEKLLNDFFNESKDIRNRMSIKTFRVYGRKQ